MGDHRSLWAAVDRLLDGIATVENARVHRLGPLAARRSRETGRVVPPSLEAEERMAALQSLTAVELIRRVRDNIDGPMLIFKGPEIAAQYRSQLRLFGDVDILLPDPHEAQRGLIAAGFVEVPDTEGLFVDIHHLIPLVHPTIPLLAVELHSRPKWPYGWRPPEVEELLGSAVPSLTGLAGVLAPSPHHHALLLAAHGWEHEPLRRIGDLLDVAVAVHELDPSEVDEIARAWRIEEIWKATRDAGNALFLGAPTPWTLRTWARHIPEVRERTVIEGHLERWLSPLAGLPRADGVRRMLARIRDDCRPAFDEGWGSKLRRTASALIHAFVPRSRHELRIGDAARKGQARNPPS